MIIDFHNRFNDYLSENKNGEFNYNKRNYKYLDDERMYSYTRELKKIIKDFEKT